VDDEIDYSLVKKTILVIIALLSLGIIAYLFLHYETMKKYDSVCLKDPRLLYAQKCSTRAECISLCEAREKSIGTSIT